MKSGFTLIELMVVVAMIGLMSTLSIVSFSTSREKARIATAQTSAKMYYDSLGDESIGVWNFDECSGTSLTDMSGQKHIATMQSGISWSTDTNKNNGCSMKFNGSGGYIDGGGLWNFNYNNFAASAWFKTSNNNEQVILTSGNNDVLEMHNGHMHMDMIIDSSPEGAKLVSDNKWHFALVTGDNTSIRIYLDGSNKPEVTMDSYPDAYSGQIYIGRCASGYYFNGLIDDVRIYQRSLTAKEIQTIYASQRSSHIAER